MIKSCILSSFSIVFLHIPIYSQNEELVISDSIHISKELRIDEDRKYTIDQINDSTRAIYYSPKWYESITNIPGDMVTAGKTVFSKEAIKPLAIIAGSTAVLYLLDRQLVDGAQKLSDNIGLDRASRFESFIKIGDVEVMQVPGNLNTGLYFIGEGWTSILIFGGIGVHGALTKNQKEIRMLSQFIEGYIQMGVVTQIFKRSFGRDTPRVATSERGRFSFFPSFSTYQNHIPQYDAMPSGHMATMALTVTLLAENYPDNQWIRPVGYSLMGLCAFSMLNNGVHWASDYPLGFGIGYLFAKVVAKRGRVLQSFVKPKNMLYNLEMSPTIFYDGNTGVRLSLKF